MPSSRFASRSLLAPRVQTRVLAAALGAVTLLTLGGCPPKPPAPKLPPREVPRLGNVAGTEGDRADVIVDAIFGIGLDRAPEGEACEAIEAMNRAGKPVLALDVPSGLNADSGHTPGICVRAAATLAFIAWKRGLWTGAAAEVGGERHEFAQGVFRFKPDGSEDPDCIFNQQPYRDAPIILSRENFGCGSSREGAVWALKGMGIRAVIAPYFGDIFNNNCFQNGLLPVALPIHEIEQLADEMTASPGNARVTIDLENCQVVSPTGRTIPFQIDARRQHAMLNGLDDIAQTLSHKDAIAAWQAQDKTARPWVWL